MNNISKLLRTSIYVLAITTSFFAIYVASGLFFPYITGKNFIFRGLVELMAVLYIPLAYLEPKYRPKFSLGVVAYSVFITVLFVANTLGINPGNSLWSNFERMEGFVTHIHLFVFTMILIAIRISSVEWEKYFKVSLIANAYVLVSAIYNYVQILSANVSGAGLSTRLNTFLGNSAYLAAYCTFGIFIALLLIAKKTNKTNKVLLVSYVLSILGNVFVIWQTGTRGTVLGLLAAIAVSLIWYGVRNINNKKTRLVILSSVAVFLSLILLFLNNKDSAYVQNNLTLKRLADISLEEQTVRSRIMIWKMSFEGVKERPFLGFGQENFVYVFAKHYNPEMFDQEQWFDRSHNVFFDWLIAAGILGLLSYLALFVTAIWTVIKNVGDRFNIHQQVAILGLFSAYFVHNIFVFDNTISYISFFTIFAYIFSKEVNEDSKKTKKKENKNMLLGVTALGVVLFGFISYNVIYKPYKVNASIYTMLSTANTSTIEDLKTLALDITSPALYGSSEANEQLLALTAAVIKSEASDTDKKFFYELALGRYGSEISKDIYNPRPPVILGGFANSVGLKDLAAQGYSEGLKRTPTKTLLWSEYAQVLVGNGNLVEAESAAQKAHSLSARSLAATEVYTAILLANNKKDQALNAWRRSIEANTHKADAYAKAASSLQKIGAEDLKSVLVNDFDQKYPENKGELKAFLEQVKSTSTTQKEL